MPIRRCPLLVAAIAGVCCCAPCHVRGDTGYEALSDWNSLPYVQPGTAAGILSSYDRREDVLGVDGLNDTNQDVGQYSGVDPADPSWKVYGTVIGPGEVTRFWMPHYFANNAYGLRVIADGQVVLSTDSKSLLSGQGGQASTGNAATDPSLFQRPLVTTLLGGQVSYEPITFQKSLIIETNTTNPYNWYQADYHTFAPGTNLPTYNGTLSAAQQSARQTAVSLLQNVGSNPGVFSAGAQSLSVTGRSLAANGSLTLANIASAGTIRALTIKLGDGSSTPTDAQLDGVMLRIHFDANAADSVEVPLSKFFGIGHGRAAYQSMALGVNPSDKSFYSYWPMPFQHNASVELVNTTGASIPNLSATVDYDPTAPGANAGYFHAVTSLQTTTAGQKSVSVLHAAGAGKYVGNLMTLTGPNASQLNLEGDDFITVDGTRHLYGTGFEDAYNGGYYFNHEGYTTDNGDVANPASGIEPLYGLLQYGNDANTGDFRVDSYRWMIGDYVPFTDGIDVSMENFGIQPGINFDSTAFYYSYDSAPEPSPFTLASVLLLPPMLLSRRRACASV